MSHTAAHEIFTKCNVWSHFWSRCSSPLFSVLWGWLFIRPVSCLLICLHVHKVKILHFLSKKKSPKHIVWLFIYTIRTVWVARGTLLARVVIYIYTYFFFKQTNQTIRKQILEECNHRHNPFLHKGIFWSLKMIFHHLGNKKQDVCETTWSLVKNFQWQE